MLDLLPSAGEWLRGGLTGAVAGAVQSGAVERGAVQSGAVERGAVQSGAVERGAVQSGAVELGAVQSGIIECVSGVAGSLAEREPLSQTPSVQGGRKLINLLRCSESLCSAAVFTAARQPITLTNQLVR